TFRAAFPWLPTAVRRSVAGAAGPAWLQAGAAVAVAAAAAARREDAGCGLRRSCGAAAVADPPCDAGPPVPPRGVAGAGPARAARAHRAGRTAARAARHSGHSARSLALVHRLRAAAAPVPDSPTVSR